MVAHADAGSLVHADQPIAARVAGNNAQPPTEHSHQIHAPGHIAATGAVAEQNIVSSARDFMKEGIKLDHRIHLAGRQVKMCGNFANSFIGDMQELPLQCIQHVQQVG